MNYTRLPSHNLDVFAGLSRPVCIFPERVTLDTPALDVMTDFGKISAFIATPGDTIGQAEERMRRRKVKLLFVMNGEDCVAGLITTTDIHGEKPMQIVQSRGIRRDEVVVSDIMTPVDRLEAIEYDEVARARVGHVLESLKARGRQHALVVEQVDGRQMVRGLLSLTQLCKQLGVAIETTEIVHTFTEIERQLAYG